MNIKTTILISSILLSSQSYAALINSYDFNNNLEDSLNNGPNLVDNGGTLSNGEYTFSNNQGLTLNNALANTNSYSIQIRVKVTDSTSGYNKLIDFQELSSDKGLYIDNGRLDFYTEGTESGNINVGEYNLITLNRYANNTIEGFINNDTIFTNTNDNNSAVSANNILNFFIDDTATGQSEAFQGVVDYIRIYDAPAAPAEVPVPAAAWLFGSALLGLAGLKKKMK